MVQKQKIPNANKKLLQIEKECRQLINDCKMCKYYKANSVVTCNDDECRMISAVSQARHFLRIIGE